MRRRSCWESGARSSLKCGGSDIWESGSQKWLRLSVGYFTLLVLWVVTNPNTQVMDWLDYTQSIDTESPRANETGDGAESWTAREQGQVREWADLRVMEGHPHPAGHPVGRELRGQG